MRPKKRYSRMYSNRTQAAQFISAEDKLACEIHVILEYPKTTAVKHAYRLDVKHISLPAIASRYFKQAHLVSYLEYLERDKLKMGSKYW